MNSKTKFFNKLLFIIFVFIIINSCNNFTNYENKDRILKNVFKKLRKDIPKENKIILIQPYLGCSACNQITINYIRKNYKNNNMIFIIPFTSMKEMKILYTPDILESTNVIIDKNNDSVKDGLVLENSLILYLINGKISKQILLESHTITQELNNLSFNMKSFNK